MQGAQEREQQAAEPGKTYAPGIYQVQTAALNIRQAPDADSRIAGTIRDQGSYTVTEIQNTSWGRLLSGAGWVNCHTAYCRYAGPAKEKSAETAKSSGKTVAEDGIWGENLTRRLQELFGTPQDGKISNQMAVNRKFCDGITAAEWDSTPKGGSGPCKRNAEMGIGPAWTAISVRRQSSPGRKNSVRRSTAQ